MFLPRLETGLSVVALGLLMACGTTRDDDGYDLPGLPEPTEGDEDDRAIEPLPDGVPPDCGEVVVTAPVVPPEVMLTLDWSCSMNETWDADQDPATGEVSRWASLHATVDALVTGWSDQIAFGVLMFPSWPNPGGEECDVTDTPNAAPALDGRDALMASIPASNASPNGSTPTRAGVEVAASVLSEDATVPRAIVILSDGAARCGPDEDAYDETLQSTVADIYQQRGIPTFMVAIDFGSDDAEMKARLNALATAGGFPRSGAQKFYEAGDEVDLAGALDEITDKVSCTVSFDQPAHGPDYTQIVIDGQTWPRVDTCEDGDGWRLTSKAAPYNTIELCGSACDALRDAGSLTAEFTCPVAG